MYINCPYAVLIEFILVFMEHQQVYKKGKYNQQFYTIFNLAYII
jgi:hypothetical protein